MSEAAPKPLIKAAEIEAQPVQAFTHPLNPNSEISGVHLSRLAGLERVGLSRVRVAPGKESFCYHTHTYEEEFIYILSGKGIAEIGDDAFEVEPGDFMGFATPSVGHHLRNPYDEDLIYLMGGESREFDVADFPRHGKRMVRCGRQIDIYPIESRESFWREEEVPDEK